MLDSIRKRLRGAASPRDIDPEVESLLVELTEEAKRSSWETKLSELPSAQQILDSPPGTQIQAVHGCFAHLHRHLEARRTGGGGMSFTGDDWQVKDKLAGLASRVLQPEHMIYPLAIRWFAERRLRMTDHQVLLDDAPLAAARGWVAR